MVWRRDDVERKNVLRCVATLCSVVEMYSEVWLCCIAEWHYGSER